MRRVERLGAMTSPFWDWFSPEEPRRERERGREGGRVVRKS